MQRLVHVGIVGVVDNDLLAYDVPFRTNAQELLPQADVGIHVEHGRVVVGLHSEEHTQRCHDQCAYPHAEPHRHFSLTAHLHGTRVDDVVGNEDDDGHHDWETKTALAYDGTERGTDEEEDQTCQRHGDFLPELNLMQTNLLVTILHHVSLAVGIHLLKSSLLQSIHDDALLALRISLRVQGVEVYVRRGYDEGCLCLMRLIAFLLLLQPSLHAVRHVGDGH